MARLPPAKLFEHRVFLRTCLGGVGIYKNVPYYIECGEMTDGCWWQKFGVVSNALVGGSGGNFLDFSTPRTEMWAFSETDFWIYRGYYMAAQRYDFLSSSGENNILQTSTASE
jgi:hypothetical protein